jgi:hypothetical protein
MGWLDFDLPCQVIMGWPDFGWPDFDLLCHAGKNGLVGL